jgi:hypothetical protein
MIAKLINAGYLQPEQRNDPDAVTKAIARMKLDLRTGNGSDDPPAAWPGVRTCRIDVNVIVALLQAKYDLSVEWGRPE